MPNLENCSVKELKEKAKKKNIKGAWSMTKAQLISKLRRKRLVGGGEVNTGDYVLYKTGTYNYEDYVIGKVEDVNPDDSISLTADRVYNRATRKFEQNKRISTYDYVSNGYYVGLEKDPKYIMLVTKILPEHVSVISVDFGKQVLRNLTVYDASQILRLPNQEEAEKEFVKRQKQPVNT